MAVSHMKVSDIVRDYPDCPQREMALYALRKGHMDLAQEWLRELQDMISEGRAKIERHRLIDDKRRA